MPGPKLLARPPDGEPPPDELRDDVRPTCWLVGHVDHINAGPRLRRATLVLAQSGQIKGPIGSEPIDE